MAQKTVQSTKTRKIAAISAGALVVGLGAAYTLASWTDSEWVWGGADNAPNIGTSMFNVQQNTTRDLDVAEWTDEQENPGGELLFTAGSLSLVPNDTIYAPVSLRTVTDSIAGSVQLQPAVAADGITVQDQDDLLWDAVELAVWVAPGDGNTAPACDDTFAAGEWTQLVDGTLADGATVPQDLQGNAQDAQNYCFAITLPADEAGNQDLQGRTIAPAWEFAAVSE